MNNSIFDLVTEEGFRGISEASFKNTLEEYNLFYRR